MRQVRTRHWACGTEVVDPLPEGYDLSEGLALVCPRCRDAWWYYPEPEPAPATAAPADMAQAEVPGPGVPPPEHPPRGRRAIGARPVNGLARLSLGVLMLAGIALLVLALADTGPLRDKRPPSPRHATAARPPVSPQPAAPARARPVVQPPATVRVSGRAFSLQRPRGWITYRGGSALVVAPGRRAPVSVRVFSSRRPNLSVPRMARLSGRTLRSRLRRASVSGPARVRHAARPALRVTARRGPTVRQVTVVAAGPRRYVVEVRVARRATDAHRTAVAGILRSLRVRG